MPREPEPWEDVGGPFITIEGPNAVVGIWSLGANRFRVRCPSREQNVEGFAEAQRIAHAARTKDRATEV
jgi:hypothetical protein